MKRRLLSLTMALALCLGLLPVTALAEGVNAPNFLYVGGTLLSANTEGGCWTTNDKGNLTEYSEGGDGWNVKYEPSSATLTLKNATIKTTHDSAQDAVIYAESSLSSAVSLTIVLQGDNTINCDSASYGIYVNAEASANSYGTDASLTIKSDGNGSLEVSGSQYGISVKSGSGNASLTIENASVDAKTTAAFSYYAGVYVRSSAKATSSPHLSLAVNGGSLTASGGESSDGIQFNVGSSQATGATTSLTVTDHAIVDARNGGISASRISETLPTPTPTDGNSSGIVFDGTEGTVYGDVTLDESLTINQGETLTIPEGSSLNCNEKLTNNGTILVESGGTLEGTVTPPTISQPPSNLTVTEGNAANFSVNASAGEGVSLTYQWQQKASDSSDWEDISDATSTTYSIDNTTTDMSGYQYRCVVTNSSGVRVISDPATLTVNQYIPPTYTISADVTPADAGTVSGGGSYAQGETVTLTATPNSDYHFVRWEENGTEVSTSATYTFTASHDCALTAVFAQNSSGGGGGGSRPDPSPSDQATDKIEDAQEGDTVEVKLPEGKTTLDKEVFEELAGRDVTLVLDLGDGVSWTVNGLDIPETADFADLDLGVSMDSGSVPVDVINAITGEIGTLQMTLAHDGDFGFTLTLSAPLGEENEGYWANLYYFDEDAETLTFQTSARIDENGTADLPFPHASQYVIAVDDRDHTPKEFPFVDVRESDWFYEAVDYVFQRDLMNGTDATHFTPDGTASRAMVATILWRMAGQPQVDYAMGFADVPVSAWYTEAVRWAAETGIVTGYSDTKFGPDDPVTREQFAVMLWRYAQQAGADVSVGEDTNILSYADAQEVSPWAISAMQWACGTGVIQGIGDSLVPQGMATRAQLATMLQRFCQAADL